MTTEQFAIHNLLKLEDLTIEDSPQTDSLCDMFLNNEEIPEEDN